MNDAHDLGYRAETAVADYLMRSGYRICARNFRVSRIGELDLVAWKDGRLSVVEVKARTNADHFGGLPAAISKAKLNRLRKTTWCFLKERQIMNIDVVFLAALVQVTPDSQIASIDIIPIEWI